MPTEHSKRAKKVALSADGRLAVSASQDKTLIVWDVATRRELRTLAGHNQEVNDVALSADGRLAVSASQDKTLIVWDIATGRELRKLTAHLDNYGVDAVGLNADGRLAASASLDLIGTSRNRANSILKNNVNVWNVVTGRKLRTLRSSIVVNDMALSTDGQLAIFTSIIHKNLIVVDLKTGRESHLLEGHSEGVNDVALSADRRLAISASQDKTIKVWNTATGRELRTLTGHTETVTGVALSADGRLAISASDDQTIKVWDVASGHCTATLLIGASLMCCAMSADGKTIVTGDKGGGVHFLELFGADELLTKDVKFEKSWLALKEERTSWLTHWFKR